MVIKRNIIIEHIEKSIEKQNIELVERKGIGHPDSICDGCCEAASQALSQYYLKNFGKVLHHNLDKGLLIAGNSKRSFKGGKIVKRIDLMIAGRATDKAKGKKIPVKEICEKAVKAWISKNLRLKDVDKVFNISIDYMPGSVELVKDVETAMANDTSFGVSHFPLSKTEKLVMDVSNLLNSEQFCKKFPSVGKDIKIMALRQNDVIRLTIAIGFIDKYISNIAEYFKIKEQIKNILLDKFSNNRLNITINALDNKNAKKEDDVYLTVTGLSAEQGDDGQVGRGNRVNGLITPCRAMSLEAAAGKNIEHPGKLYQILAYAIAKEIAKIEGVKECEVKILSKIGSRLDNPEVINIKLYSLKKIDDKVKKIVNNSLDRLSEIQKEIVFGKYDVC